MFWKDTGVAMTEALEWQAFCDWWRFRHGRRLR